MLKLKVDFWKTSLDVPVVLPRNIGATGKPDELLMTFDTGAYMTVIDSFTLKRAGYDVEAGRDARVDTVGNSGIKAKEIVLHDLELLDMTGLRISLGPVLVYAIDMSDTFTTGVLGLNVIREFKTSIKFGSPTVIELTPTFDIYAPVKLDNFMPYASRFGTWSRDSI
ncbi:MAG: aspartyl protease family protein [Defluviitaleaceae bacterium]|nr:aspartyl protease family protein [Defluviitaleaceae bacterium]